MVQNYVKLVKIKPKSLSNYASRRDQSIEYKVYGSEINLILHIILGISMFLGKLNIFNELKYSFRKIAKWPKVGENTTKSMEESAPEFPEKMTVRPILQKVYPKQNEKANKQQKDGQYVPPEFENESVGMEEMLEIYGKIAEGKEPEDLKQLFWDNEAAYKFIKKLELKLESDQKHENMAAQDVRNL
jgi:hypothetical protein